MSIFRSVRKLDDCLTYPLQFGVETSRRDNVTLRELFNVAFETEGGFVITHNQHGGARNPAVGIMAGRTPHLISIWAEMNHIRVGKGSRGSNSRVC